MLGLPFRGCWGFGWKEAGKAPDTLTLMAPVEKRPSHCRGDQKGTSWKGGGPRRSWGAVRTTSDCISLAQQAAQPPTHLLCLVLNFSGTGIPFLHAGDLAQSESGACSPPLGGLGLDCLQVVLTAVCGSTTAVCGSTTPEEPRGA